MRRIGAETAPLGAKTAAGDAAATDHPPPNAQLALEGEMQRTTPAFAMGYP